MANTAINERQYMRWAVADCSIANSGTSLGYTVHIPAGGLVLLIYVDTITAFNSQTTDTLTVADGTTTFANAVDTTSTGRETVSNIGKVYPTGGTITISLAHTGTVGTAGRALVTIGYVVPGAAHEYQS